ncbi:dirigent protein 22-like [Hordeum vulgare subsp. vulgare]|uniref:Dirigent protein n=1 Tax=Hordeum vulgare subsp. vulgare TaxID=112509 RepID=A0A8I6XXW0_HORVV|nr:dirigent protein 22-like [Hordeum vulgare subsp. vulgare]KAI4963787.1 hypothetical protein ZWY2020_010500 [Hordeum vulgare]KAI4997509.1 hypothetical protein ZWY2020_052851 [Hordeum vulgare]
MAKGAMMLLVLFTVLSAVTEAQLQHGPGHSTLARRHRQSADPEAPPTHLHFYFHDTVSGASPSAVRVAGPADPSSGTFFGMVTVMDDPLTEGPEPGSAAVGRAQGLYMGADQAELGFLQTMNLVLTSGPYNGSTLAVLGRNCPLTDVREMPVVGGTGAFRFARGYAQARTHWLDFMTGDATVEYDVYVMH